jgi:(p)ppGpp synthase/HD superfamily hydrolase
MTTVTDQRDNLAHMRISISITGLPQLSQLLTRISQVPNVISAKRKK